MSVRLKTRRKFFFLPLKAASSHLRKKKKVKLISHFHCSHCPIRFHTVLMGSPPISGSSCKRFRRAHIARCHLTTVTSATPDPTATSGLHPLRGGVHRTIFMSMETETTGWHRSRRSEIAALCIRLQEKCRGNTYATATTLCLGTAPGKAGKGKSEYRSPKS